MILFPKIKTGFQKKALMKMNALIRTKNKTESMTKTIVSPTIADLKLKEFSMNFSSFFSSSATNAFKSVMFLIEIVNFDSKLINLSWL